MDSIELIINDLFSDDFIFKMQASEPFGKTSIQNFKKSDYIFFGGTNALTSNINKEKYIGFSIFNLIHFNRLLLLGVGWWQYQDKPNYFTKIFLKRALDSSLLHSVRDSYTQNMLSSIGIDNVLNTSCPSTWNLTNEHCSQISKSQSDSVVFTITDYNKDLKADSRFINHIQNHYKEIFFWPQGLGDLNYFYKLNLLNKINIKILKPNLESFDSLLRSKKIDYIGTRLHAGIRALQNKSRALILAIDNRALEIAKDIQLDISERGNLNKVSNFIENSSPSLIKIPSSEIEKWKNQFRIDSSSSK
jgi:polysaccharide pyruvyl transferase WcaK-like protein